MSGLSLQRRAQRRRGFPAGIDWSRAGEIERFADCPTSMYHRPAFTGREEGDHMFLTGAQVRAARAALRLEQAELAAAAGISEQTIRRIEKADGPIEAARVGTLREVVEVFGKRGVTFGEENGAVVVRLALATAPAPRRRP